MNTSLGTVQLSKDVLNKSRIGLWAFELDEGDAPRMYVDDTMLGLIGLDHQISPEETYHAWYDHIDPKCYGLVAESVEKMGSGVHSEVQYPWHHPDGHTIIVRCGGVRNFAYKKGIRIEGTHQDVSQTIHYDDQERKRMKEREIQLSFEQMKNDALLYVVKNTPTVEQFFDAFGHRIISLMGCDLITFHGLDGRNINVCAKGADPISDRICSSCPFAEAESDFFVDDYVEVLNAADGFRGIRSNAECPSKCFIMHRVYQNGRLAGKCSLHYFRPQTSFPTDRKEFMSQMAGILNILLNFQEAETKAEKLHQMMENESDRNHRLTEFFIKNAEAAYLINVSEDSVAVLKRNPTIHDKLAYKDESHFRKSLESYIESCVYPADRERLKEATSYDTIEARFRTTDTINLNFRNTVYGYPVWYELSIAKLSENQMLFSYRNCNQQVMDGLANHVVMNDFASVYFCDLESDKIFALKETLLYERPKHPTRRFCFSDVSHDMVSIVDQDFKEGWNEFVENIAEHLTEQTKSVYTFVSNVTGHNVWLRAAFHTIERDKGKPVTVLMTFNNVTREQALKLRENEQNTAINNLLALVDDGNSTEETLDSILRNVASFYQADRAYIMELSEDGTYLTNTREWCSEGIKSLIKEQKKVPSECLKGWFDEFRATGLVTVNPLGNQDSPLEMFYETHNMGTVLAAPLLLGDRISGMVGIDNPRIEIDNPRVLKAACSVSFSEILKNKKYREAEQHGAQIARDKMSDIFSRTFMDTFASAYYVNLDNLSSVVFLAGEYDRRYDAKANYLNALTHFFNDRVDEDDRAEALKAVDPKYMKRRLKEVAKYSSYIQVKSDTKPIWYRLDVARGEDASHAGIALTDVTEKFEADRIAAEREKSRLRALESARKAKEANKMKTQFVQNISHDIRTPLNAIVGYSQLLAMPDGTLTEAEKEEFASYVNDSADMLTMLIADVLNMSDVEHGILKIDKEDMPCNEVCRKAARCSSMRVMAGVKLYTTSDLDDSFTIHSDPRRIQQILVNFLSNSCKHTEKGEIRVHCSKDENPGFVTFSVTDTGCGIAPGKAEQIFARFSTLDNHFTSHGLGLDICRDLAVRLGGKVSLDTEYKTGARFTLQIPLK